MTHKDFDQLFSACFAGEAPWDALADWLQEQWHNLRLKFEESLLTVHHESRNDTAPFYVRLEICKLCVDEGDVRIGFSAGTFGFHRDCILTTFEFSGPFAKWITRTTAELETVITARAALHR